VGYNCELEHRDFATFPIKYTSNNHQYSPWYITNNKLHHDLNIPTVKEEVKTRTKAYKTRIQAHPNAYASQLMNPKKIFHRLKRKAPQDLIDD